MNIDIVKDKSAKNKLAKKYIHKFSELAPAKRKHAVIIAHISGRTQKRRGNLPNQTVHLQNVVAESGCLEVGHYEEVSSGWILDHRPVLCKAPHSA